MKWLICILLFFPYAISLPASDLERGQTYSATVSAPEGSAVSVQAPAWAEISTPVYEGGDTWRAVLSVSPSAPDAYGRVTLLVDGAPVASQGVRVGNVTMKQIYLPLAFK